MSDEMRAPFGFAAVGWTLRIDYSMAGMSVVGPVVDRDGAGMAFCQAAHLAECLADRFDELERMMADIMDTDESAFWSRAEAQKASGVWRCFDMVDTTPPSRDERGHFPGCYSTGCETTLCWKP